MGVNTTVVIRVGTLDDGTTTVKSVISILVTSGVGIVVIVNESETMVTFGDADGDIKLDIMEVSDMVDVGRIIFEILGGTTTLLEISIGILVTIGNIDVSVITTKVVNNTGVVSIGIDDISSSVSDGCSNDVILVSVVVVTSDVSGNGVVNINVDNTGLVETDVTAVVSTVSVNTGTLVTKGLGCMDKLVPWTIKVVGGCISILVSKKVLEGKTITGEEKLVSVTLGAVNRGKELVSITAVVKNGLNDNNVSVIKEVSSTTVVIVITAGWDVSLGEMKGVKLSNDVTTKEGVNITSLVTTLLNTGVVTTKDGILLSSPIVVNTVEGVITGVESTMMTGVDLSGNRLVISTEKLGVVVKTAAALVNKDVVNSTGIVDDGSIGVIDGVGIMLVLSTTIIADETTKEGVAVNIVSMVRRSEVIAIVNNEGVILDTG